MRFGVSKVGCMVLDLVVDCRGLLCTSNQGMMV